MIALLLLVPVIIFIGVAGVEAVLRFAEARHGWWVGPCALSVALPLIISTVIAILLVGEAALRGIS